MKNLKLLLIAIISILCLTATASEQNGDNVNVEYYSIWFWDNTKIANDTNGNFSLTWDHNGIKKLSLNMAEPNIRNFSFFTRGLYRQYLKDKLSNGEELSKGEIEILCVCLITEIVTINTYSYVFAKELGIENDIDFSSFLLKPKNSEIKNTFTSTFYDNIQKMQENFINDSNHDIMYSALANFANQFKDAEKSHILKDITNIQNNQRKDLWGRRWYSPSVQIKIKKEDVNTYDKCDISPINFSGNWLSICKRNDLCMSNIYDIRKDIDDFISKAKNGSNMNTLDHIDLVSRESIDKAVRTNLILFNDFPASVCGIRCLSKIYDSKGFFDDDETKMKNAMTEFVTSIRGEKIPLRFSSIYSSSLYTQITQVMKEELNGEWEEYKFSMGLVNMNELDDLFGVTVKNKEQK